MLITHSCNDKRLLISFICNALIRAFYSVSLFIYANTNECWTRYSVFMILHTRVRVDYKRSNEECWHGTRVESAEWRRTGSHRLISERVQG